MRLPGSVVLALLWWTASALAEVPQPQECRMAMQAAERGNTIPAHLLAAIGRVESGRWDPISGIWNSWPWSVNAEGTSLFYDTKAQAVSAARAMQAKGMRSIDVGCMQINLMHHPNAFPTLELAFEPAVNVAYAARFLLDLYGQTGSWGKAVALYHSATPELAADYQRKVLAVWPEESPVAAVAAPAALARAWAATMRSGPPGAGGGSQALPPGRAAAARLLLQTANNGAIPRQHKSGADGAATLAVATRLPPPRGRGG